MAGNLKTICWRTTFIFIEVVVILALLLGLILGIAVWFLRSGPVDVTFAKDYVQNALKDNDRGNYATMETIVLHWPDLSGPVLLGLRDANILKEDGSVLVSVDEVALALSKSKLLIGKIAPEALILREPTVKLVRAEDGQFDIGFETADLTDENAQEQTAMTDRILQYLRTPEEEKESSPLASLKSFIIEDATVYVQDNATNRNWVFPDVYANLQSTEEGLMADIKASMKEQAQDRRADLNVALTMPWDSENISVNAALDDFKISDIAQYFSGTFDLSGFDISLDADVNAVFDSTLTPVSAGVSLTSDAGSIVIENAYEEPLAYQNLLVDLRYDQGENKLDLRTAQVQLKNLNLDITGDVTIGEERIEGPVRLSVKKLEHADIAPLWPEFLEGDNSQEWIVEKMSNGTFYNAYAQTNLVIQKDELGEWDADIQNLIAGFDFENLDVNYRPPLEPIRQANGSGTFDLDADTLIINVKSGLIDDLQVSNGSVAMGRVVEEGAGDVQIHLDLTGPLSSVFEYVEDEPIGQKQDFPVDQVLGQADLKVSVGFPLSSDVKVEEIDVAIKGKLNGAFLPQVINDMDLSEGDLNLTVKDNRFKIEGRAKLADAPIALEYEGFLESKGQPYRRKLSADFVADKRLRQKFGADIDMFLEGRFPVFVTYTEYHNRPSTADIQIDLTPGTFKVDPFDYRKTPGQRGSASLSALMSEGKILEIRDLQGTAPNFKLDSTTLVFRQRGEESELHVGQISRFQLEETIAGLEFEIEPSGALKMVLEGPFLDVRPFLDTEGEDPSRPYENPPMLISVAVDRMRTDEGQSVEYAKLYIDIDSQGRFNQFELDAIAGAGDIYLRYKPDDQGMRVFRFEADDAGAALKAFGIYDNIVGGTMTIYGEPIRSLYDRNLVGAAELRDFKVVKAPAMAKLFSALSFTGLMNALNNEGVIFTKLKANFDWLYRPDGSLLVLKDGRTSGNSLGLTFDGTFDNAAGTLDVSGTIVPLSGVNKVISNIPLIGTILSGGSDSVFAATYDMEGLAKNPEIFVNPLSVLTPGLLRRILFEQN